jgi:hypothetical protein
VNALLAMLLRIPSLASLVAMDCLQYQAVLVFLVF